MITVLVVACSPSPSLSIYNAQHHQGETLSGTALQGHVLLLNFWAPWCKPCIEEIPQLNQFAAQHADRVIVLAVNFEHPKSGEIPSAADLAGIRYASLISDPATVFNLPDISGLPTTLVLNDQGAVIKTLAGTQTLQTLEAALKP